MRKLATIEKILKIEQHSNADLLEVATVKGWSCVVKKGEFKEGDLCVYLEVDSFLPIKPNFEFLRKSSYKKMPDGTEGFRLKTIRLRKQLSQGLILPMSIFGEAAIEFDEVGQDATNFLGIIKYEPPIPAQLAGKVKGMFPIFVKKTDQERIQNLTEFFDKHSDMEFEVTEKLDGSSCTYYWNEGQFGVCSRNLELLESENNSLWKIAKDMRIREYLTSRNIAVQGEIVGEGIQGNPYKIQGQKFFVFDVWDIEHQRHFTPHERSEFIKPSFMKQVPAPENADITPLKTTLDKLLVAAEGKSALNNLAEREGLVFKSTKRVNGQIISFKVINNQYLLGEK